jgi:hypothetical protein
VFLVNDKKNDGIEDQVAEDVQQQIPSEESLAKGMQWFRHLSFFFLVKFLAFDGLWKS